jgi:hypothetical protein
MMVSILCTNGVPLENARMRSNERLDRKKLDLMEEIRMGNWMKVASVEGPYHQL